MIRHHQKGDRNLLQLLQTPEQFFDDQVLFAYSPGHLGRARAETVAGVIGPGQRGINQPWSPASRSLEPFQNLPHGGPIRTLGEADIVVTRPPTSPFTVRADPVQGCGPDPLPFCGDPGRLALKPVRLTLIMEFPSLSIHKVVIQNSMPAGMTPGGQGRQRWECRGGKARLETVRLHPFKFQAREALGLNADRIIMAKSIQ